MQTLAFCRDGGAVNRLRREEEAAETSKRKELAKVERQIARIIEAVKEGLYVPAMKGELLTLRREAYQPKGLWFRLDESSGAGHAFAKLLQIRCKPPWA